MKRLFEIIQIKPNIFLFKFKDYYDMAMHFLRYQEYYESASPQFRGKQFEIFDFMRWYSKKYGKDAFTYPKDWGGFNIPSSVIMDVHALVIKDFNKYDASMFGGWDYCAQIIKDTSPVGTWVGKHPKFYIIGSVDSGSTLKHEVAHGFFYTIPEYKKEMTALVKALPLDIRKLVNKTLSKMGYTPKVFIDETQAYMATGLYTESNPKFEDKLKKARKPFIKLFNKYNI